MTSPGELYMYNTPAYSRTVTVLERVTGMDVNAYTSQWLTSRIGMQDSGWWTRPGEVMVPSPAKRSSGAGGTSDPSLASVFSRPMTHRAPPLSHQRNP